MSYAGVEWCSEHDWFGGFIRQNGTFEVIMVTRYSHSNRIEINVFKNIEDVRIEAGY